MTQYTDSEKRLYATVQVGDQVRQFLHSDVGRLLHGRAKQDIEEATKQLPDCNVDSWFGRRKFKKLQFQIEVAQQFERWCADAIIDGDNALKELTS